MNINYNELCEDLICKIKEEKIKPKLLLHSCCAPCSSHVISFLTNFFDITIFYYNPNIFPYDEYLKRKNEQLRLIKEIEKINSIDLLDCDYDNDLYNKLVLGLENEPERGGRCKVCYNMRLEKTAEIAKKNGFDYFCTTLSVSPFKNSSLINQLGIELSKKYNIKWLPSDFKKKNGYYHSIELSKKYNLYRQNYCGCIFSKQVYLDKLNHREDEGEKNEK